MNLPEGVLQVFLTKWFSQFNVSNANDLSFSDTTFSLSQSFATCLSKFLSDETRYKKIQKQNFLILSPRSLSNPVASLESTVDFYAAELALQLTIANRAPLQSKD
jgi:hypothetical protein